MKTSTFVVSGADELIERADDVSAYITINVGIMSHESDQLLIIAIVGSPWNIIATRSGDPGLYLHWAAGKESSVR